MNPIEHDTAGRRFTTRVDGHQAVLDYTLASDVMTITHTGVPKPISGRGVAGDLMHAALTAARAAKWSVNPACSYAAAYMRRHPDNGGNRHIDDLLDEALDESFPASDPPAVGGSN